MELLAPTLCYWFTTTSHGSEWKSHATIPGAKKLRANGQQGQAFVNAKGCDYNSDQAKDAQSLICPVSFMNPQEWIIIHWWVLDP